MAGFALPAVLRAAEPDRFGDLVGRFLWTGKIPDRRKLKVDRDLDFCGKFDIRDESLMVGWGVSRNRGMPILVGIVPRDRPEWYNGGRGIRRPARQGFHLPWVMVGRQ